MAYVFNENMTKAKEQTYARRLDAMLSSIDENVRAIKEINKENDRLKKLNDRSVKRLRKSISELSSY